MENLAEYAGFGLVPVIVALVAWLKAVWPECPPRWYPVWALTLGVLLNIALALLLKTDVATAAFVGLLVGLAAGGFYGFGKATLLGQ